jgi:nicotinamidase-related amidase
MPKSTSPAYEPLTPDNSAFLLIDYQMGLMLATGSMPLEQLKTNTVGLAKMLALFQVPGVITTGGVQSPEGGSLDPLIAPLREVFPTTSVLPRSSLDAWRDRRVVEALEKLGRRKIIMAGISTDICLTFTSIAARDAGYEPYVVVDACATWDERSERAAWTRMAQHGVILTNWIAIAAELQADWRARPATVPDYVRTLATHNAAFGGMMQSFGGQGQRS